MKITFKEFSFLFAWIALIVFGTLVLGYDSILEKSLYLSVAIICELWILFSLPGSRSLWIFPKNADNSKYQKIRIISAFFLWFLMLAIPKGFDLFVYYIFALCIERIIFFYSSKNKEKILQKLFPPYKKYGIIFFIALITGFLFVLFLFFEIGAEIGRKFL